MPCRTEAPSDFERVLQARPPMRTFAIAALLALAHCEKAPPEPASPSSGTSRELATEAETPRAKPSPKRCVVPVSETPPPAVAKASRCPKDPESAPPMVPIGHVEFPEAGAAPRVEVELMLNDAHRARGLMYRTSLDDEKGMLFAWTKPDYRSFWMRDTCIPLDMLFIDTDGYIAGIAENVPPMNDESRGIDCPVTYVLEVNAGFTRKHGIRPGQRVHIEGLR